VSWLEFGVGGDRERMVQVICFFCVQNFRCEWPGSRVGVWSVEWLASGTLG